MSRPASNGKTLLITGINGYIASVLGHLVLSKGYSLRGTTRRAVSAEPLLAGPYAAYKDRVQIYEVPNMTIDGAFDEAAKDVDGIFHTASPFNLSLDSFDKTVTPAMRGCEVLLTSALNSGPNLKAVVVTSSVAAITDSPPPTPDHVYTEAEFASTNLKQAIRERDTGVQTPGNVLYAASKTAADRKVWEFRKNHKPSFAISTINPSVVVGPPVILPASGSKLNETLRPIFNILSGEIHTLPPNKGSGSFVDVRDVAFMHLWAFENPSKADGERYIACGGYGPTQAVADILHEKYRGTVLEEKILVGDPGKGYTGYARDSGKVEKVLYSAETVQVSGKKAERVMGIKYISFQRSVVDTAKVLEKLL